MPRAKKSPATTEKQPAEKKAVKKPKVVSSEDKEAKKKRRQSNSYASYIYKVLKQVHPDTGISRKAMIIMDNVSYFF